MSASRFVTPPHATAPSSNLTPTSIAVTDSELERLKTLLSLSPVPQPNIWNTSKTEYYGLPRDELLKLINYWKDEYDWRKWESTLNSIPQFNITIPDDDSKAYKINFFALFSTNPSAVPVLFLHGWPGSAVEYLPILRKLQSQYEPESLPYHIVVPHFIGYPFSDAPPLDKKFTHHDNARLCSKMMHALGFGATGYVAGGGDLGGWTAPSIANLDPACKLVHMTMLDIPPPEGENVEQGMREGRYSDDEVAAFQRQAQVYKSGSAFIQLDGTRPATAGYLLNSNPVALLSWVGEKMIEWSDETPDRDLIITNVALYWFTGCYATSIYHHLTFLDSPEHLTSAWKALKVPLGHSWFKNELLIQPKRWIEQSDKVKWYRMHDKGGHFAALEEPETLWKDVEDFIREFWHQAG